MDEAPPPPPPHGENPRTTRSGGLPDGKYDIFVIPPSSAGSGFLYLPSFQTQRNSFLAGCFCTATAFFFYSVAMPVAKEWFYNTVNGGGSGVLMLVLGVGVVSWALGKTQGEGTGTSTPRGFSSSSKTYSDPPPQSKPETSSPPPPPPPPPREPTPPPEPEPPPKPQSPPPKPKSTWQRSTPNNDGKSAWEKAREETRKREEERKKAADIQRRREELERERQRQREKETLERLEREFKEKKAKEEEAQKKAEEEAKAQQAKDENDKRIQREKQKRELEARNALLQAAKEAREAKEALERTRKEDEERRKRDEQERLAAEARAKAEADAAAARAARSARESNVSSNKRPPMPSARTEREDDAYSFRPYDRAKGAQKSSSGSVYSDDSYAPSATTARTTPPGSTRGPYTTKDPDKIIIKGVYSFNNAFMRTPISQLISGQGNVTDGLILRITTEGLFIDDDVRGIPQREWDVKAWTMKLAESIELQGHQILRASIRDGEGKKYVFILSQTESWKVAIGLQRLRKGSQVRSLGVAGMPMNEARILLESLGWA